MIDAREPQILERPGAKGIEQALFGRGGVLVAARHALQKCMQLGGIHLFDLRESPTVI